MFYRYTDLAPANGKSTGLTRGMAFKERVKNTPDWAKDRSDYKPGDPIGNVYSLKLKFFMFPDAKANPFGYTFDELRQKHDDANNNIDDSGYDTAPNGYSTLSSIEPVSSTAASPGAPGGLIFLVFLVQIWKSIPRCW